MKLKTLAVTALSVAVLTTGPAGAALVVNGSTLGQRVFVASTADVIARYEGATAGIASDLFLQGRAGVIFNNGSAAVGNTVNLGSFAVGTELVFRLATPGEGDIFTDPASRAIPTTSIKRRAISTRAGPLSGLKTCMAAVTGTMTTWSSPSRTRGRSCPSRQAGR